MDKQQLDAGWSYQYHQSSPDVLKLTCKAVCHINPALVHFSKQDAYYSLPSVLCRTVVVIYNAEQDQRVYND